MYTFDENAIKSMKILIGSIPKRNKIYQQYNN